MVLKMNIHTKNIVLIVLFIFLTCFPALPRHAFSEGKEGVIILNTEEIKVEGEEETRDIVSLEEVEESRTITKERIYGLLFIWFIIIVCIILLKYQLKDDEKLYKAGYYND